MMVGRRRKEEKVKEEEEKKTSKGVEGEKEIIERRGKDDNK